jgi:CheY-like chemotaxis protein
VKGSSKGFFLVDEVCDAPWLELDHADRLVGIAGTAAGLLGLCPLPGQALPPERWSAALPDEPVDALRALAKTCRNGQRRAGGRIVLRERCGEKVYAVTAERVCEERLRVRLTLNPATADGDAAFAPPQEPPPQGTESPPGTPAAGRCADAPAPAEAGHDGETAPGAAGPAEAERAADGDSGADSPATVENDPGREAPDAHVEAAGRADLSLEARSIVHDFKNLLTGIVGNLSLARKQAGDNGSLQSRLKAAESAAQRARDLALQLLSEEEGRALVKHPVRLADLVDECIEQTLGGTQCACTASVPQDLWTVPVDEGRFCQALSNLFIHAMQAMNGKGAVTVRADNRCLSADNAHGLPEGAYVQLEVADRGPGIPDSLRERIFEPLFTTKQSGNGLGLCNVKKILEAHGGTVLLDSVEGAGAIFTFLLPALPDVTLPSNGVFAAEPTEKPLTVLVVDDNAMVRETAGDLLAAIGYAPAFAAGPDEALEQMGACRGRGNPVRVILLDLNLSNGYRGQDLAPRLREREPEARVLLCSGSSGPDLEKAEKAARSHGSVVKPFTVDQLRRSISGALATRA